MSPEAPLAARARAAHALATLSLTLTLALGASGCAGAPWFLGSPRGREPLVPASDGNPALAELHARRLDAVEAGRPWQELAALRRLAERGALRPAERARLGALLAARARAWRADARPRAELAVRRELAALGTPSPESTPAALEDATLRAARAWWEAGDLAQARQLGGEAVARWGAPPSDRTTPAPCRPGPDDPCRLVLLVFPPSWFAAESPPEVHVDRGREQGDEELLASETLTEAFRRGGLAFTRRMAFHPDAALFVETLRLEDDTSPFNWEVIAWLELLRGHKDAAARAFGQSAAFHPSRAEAWTRAAVAWEAASALPEACAAWRRAAAVRDDPWDPRWPRLLRCLALSPEAGDARQWSAFLQEKVELSARADHARWLGASD